MNKHLISILGLAAFCAVMFLSSCVTNRKFIYLQDNPGVKFDSTGAMLVKPYAYRLQKGDILYISLTTDDEKLNSIFVPKQTSAMGMMQAGSGTPFYLSGFTINSAGAIEMPYLGQIVMEGKTIEEAKVTLEEALKKFFKVFFLQIKVAEFKFSILGTVNRPGQYFFQQNRVSLLEALTQAGDLKDMADRRRVQLYRQTPQGIRMFQLDLTDRSLVNSEFWYVQPNDIVYVLPLKTRVIGEMTSADRSVGAITPLLNTLFLVINSYLLIKSLK